MEGNKYQELAMRTNDGGASERLNSKIEEYFGKCLCDRDNNDDVGGILNACLGLSGEVGEVNDQIKKWIFHGHELDKENIEKEIGDILWYVAMMCESFNFSIDNIMTTNIEKLKKRYPEGFSEQASINRTE